MLSFVQGYGRSLNRRNERFMSELEMKNVWSLDSTSPCRMHLRSWKNERRGMNEFVRPLKFQKMPKQPRQ
jgi:hypothetical protein